MPSANTALDRALVNEQEVLTEWVQLQLTSSVLRSDLMKEGELREQSREFLTLFRAALTTGTPFSLTTGDWAAVRDFLAGVTRSRALQGFSPSETATFVLSLKQPVFAR